MYGLQRTFTANVLLPNFQIFKSVEHEILICAEETFEKSAESEFGRLEIRMQNSSSIKRP